MRGTTSNLSLPLPKGWPRRVRSAVVHAVSIANVVFTVTRSQAEHHFNARVRLQAENDRLRNEISLLHEELRIKDGRMERIPAQRRPHYPPVERLAIFSCARTEGSRRPREAGKRQRDFRTNAVSLRRCFVGNLDDVTEVLAGPRR